MPCPHCNSFLVPATNDQIQSNQSLPSLSCRLLHLSALGCFFIVSITTSHAIITCPLSLLQLEPKFHKDTVLCTAVCSAMNEWPIIYKPKPSGPAIAFLFSFYSICTNMNCHLNTACTSAALALP